MKLGVYNFFCGHFCKEEEVCVQQHWSCCYQRLLRDIRPKRPIKRDLKGSLSSTFTNSWAHYTRMAPPLCMHWWYSEQERGPYMRSHFKICVSPFLSCERFFDERKEVWLVRQVTKAISSSSSSSTKVWCFLFTFVSFVLFLCWASYLWNFIPLLPRLHYNSFFIDIFSCIRSMSLVLI